MKKLLLITLVIIMVIISFGALSVILSGIGVLKASEIVVEYNGEILETGAEISVGYAESINLNTTGFSKFFPANEKFIIKSIVNSDLPIDSDFEFTVDGNKNMFSRLDDVSSGIEYTITDSSVVFENKQDMYQILKSMYPEQSVVVPLRDYASVSFFTILFLDKSGKEYFRFNLKTDLNVRAESVEISDKEIILWN